MSKKYKHTPENYDVNQFYIPEAATSRTVEMRQPDPEPLRNLGEFAIRAGIIAHQIEPASADRNEVGVK